MTKQRVSKTAAPAEPPAHAKASRPPRAAAGVGTPDLVANSPQPASKARNPNAELILANATKLFSERGYEGVSVRDIAKVSGFTLPTIYHYFGEKRHLYMEVCELEFARANAVLIAALNSPGKPQARLRRFVEALCKLLSENVQFSNLLQRELLDQDQEILEVSTRVGLMEEFKIVASLVDAIDPNPHADRVAFSIYAMAFGFILLRPVGAMATSSRLLPTDNKALARLILSLVFPRGL